MLRNPNEFEARRNRVRASCKSAFYAAIAEFVWNNLFCFELLDEHLIISESDTRRRLQTEDEYTIDATFEYNDNVQDYVFETANYDNTDFASHFHEGICSEFGSEGLVDSAECVQASTEETVVVGDPIEAVSDNENNEESVANDDGVTGAIWFIFVCVTHNHHIIQMSTVRNLMQMIRY